MQRFYFTFGSDQGYPYQDTYLIVVAQDLPQAIQTFRENYPDRQEGVVNCAFWYAQEEWNHDSYKNQQPADIIIAKPKWYSWDEIYEKAIGAAYHDIALRVKDQARWEVTQLMLRNKEPDPILSEIPEDAIEAYCNRFGIRFAENGSIAGYDLPYSITETIYRQKQTEYIKQDLANRLLEIHPEREDLLDFLDDMAKQYVLKNDSDISYNDTIDHIIGEFAAKERVSSVEKKTPKFTHNTVATYSGEQNHLPYDVKIETLHIESEEEAEDIICID